MISQKSMENYYRLYASKITNYLVANGLPRSLAEDVTQTVFLKIWQKRETLVLENEESFSGYLFTAARNESVDYYRKNSRITFTDEVPEPEPAPDDSRHADKAYIRSQITAAMNQLPKAIRETYTLFAIGERSVSEIARITNCKESLVKVRLFRARQKLQLQLASLMAE